MASVSVVLVYYFACPSTLRYPQNGLEGASMLHHDHAGMFGS